MMQVGFGGVIGLPLEGGGRCVHGLAGEQPGRACLDRRLRRWTHRVGEAQPTRPRRNDEPAMCEPRP